MWKYFSNNFLDERVCENEVQVKREEQCQTVEDEECVTVTDKECSTINQEECQEQLFLVTEEICENIIETTCNQKDVASEPQEEDCEIQNDVECVIETRVANR